MTSFMSAYLGPRYQFGAPLPGLTAAQADVRNRLITDDRAEDWEEVDCCCGAVGGRVLTEVDRHGLSCRNVLCVVCGLVRVTPRWTSQRYARFYKNEYRALYSARPNMTMADAARELAAGPSAGLVAKFVERSWQSFGSAAAVRPVIVEIGAGGGWNLSRLGDHWSKIGYDSDESFLALGRELFGVDMRTGFISEAFAAAANADCILLSHVLEHVPDPVTTLRELGAVARPNALILVEVPGIFRLHRTWLDPMRYWQNAHTYTFCAGSIADICRRANLEPLAVNEWVHLILRPANVASRHARLDKSLAVSIERYLRFCEHSYRLAQSVGRAPLIGPATEKLVRRGANAVVRMADGLRLVNGMRAPQQAGLRLAEGRP
jgi:SAM-dependent methyltransferase